MAFFTFEFNYNTLDNTWHKRKNEILQERLRPFADLLYKAIRESIFARRAEIHAAMVEATSKASGPQDLHIPIWSYVAACFRKYDPEVHDEIRNAGHDWSVCYGGEHQSVDWIIRKTDICARIACLFDTHMFHVKWANRPLPEGIVEQTENYTVWSRDLVLHWFPAGNMLQSIKLSNMTAEEKYRLAELPPVRPLIYKGTPGFSNRTPPPKPPADAPPPVGVDRVTARQLMWDRNCARDECPTQAAFTRHGFSVDDAPVCYCQVCEPDSSEE